MTDSQFDQLLQAINDQTAAIKDQTDATKEQNDLLREQNSLAAAQTRLLIALAADFDIGQEGRLTAANEAKNALINLGYGAPSLMYLHASRKKK